MFSSLRPIFALLCGTAFLLAASGLHGLLLPLRGQAEAVFDDLARTAGHGLGLRLCRRLLFSVRAWCAGPAIIRSFAALAATAAIVALASGLWIGELGWIILRRLHRIRHGRRLHDHRELAQRARDQ